MDNRCTANSNLRVHCDVLSMDATKYTDDFLRGGIRLQPANHANQITTYGTLGCLGHDEADTQDPQGKVVAIANQCGW